MALSSTQTGQLDALNRRIATGYKPTATDQANLSFAEKQGYKYKSPTTSLTLPTASNLPVLNNPTATTALPADKLSNPYGDLSKMLGANVNPNTVSSDVAGLLALTGKDTAAGTEVNALQGQLTDLMKQKGGQATDLQTEMDKQGVNDNWQHVKELTLKSAQLQGELGNFDAETEKQKSAIEEQAIPTGLLQGQAAQLQKQRDLTRLGKAAELSATVALTQAYNGNAQLGEQLAQKAVDMKYAPIENSINTLKTQLGFATDKMSTQDSARSKVISYLLDQHATSVSDQKAKDGQIASLAVQAASGGAPLSVVNAMKASGDPAKAAVLASQWLKGPTESTVKGKKGTTPTSTPTDPAKMSTTQLKTDYNLSVDGLKGHVQVKSGGPGRLTREEAARQIFSHYGGRIPMQTILKDIYKNYPG